ncbi:hypothetical protein HYDPIDRAFT_167525 [Hydnomerulius pinastri MD-312]|uniref:FAD/NAD(P)-binding domain-containing protein n=1 Tax=Hydnomerulius pinastri MD-312 TaxID=994086 RepID=A0A0C9WGE9_9AGAM|nr:hypothetical protein HYDPIDRAFT_167525 [Hydnomerulius pinastri MD-312]
MPPGSFGIKIIVVGAGYGGFACAIECDIISLGPDANCILLARWGLHDSLRSICGHHHRLTLHNYLGVQIRDLEFELPSFGAYPCEGHRAKVHRAGVQINLGEEVETYWEDAERGVSGVTTTAGEVYKAGLLVVSDGVRSPARKYVLGYTDTSRPPGYSVYRAWFDAVEQVVDKDPPTSFLCINGDVLYGWIGQDVRMLTLSRKNGKDKQTCRKAFRAPCGPRNTPVRDAQLTGESTRNKWHQAKPDEHGKHLDLPRPAWLFGFDAEARAYSVCGAATKKIEEKGYQLPTLS